MNTSVAPPPQKTIPTGKAKAQKVQGLFNRIAPTYDLLNNCISLGMHQGWKKKACEQLQLSPGSRVLDVCTGTGDLTGILSQKVGPTGNVVGLDFSEEMLTLARQRFAEEPNIQFTQGDAMALPFSANEFDGAIISFGLRNVADIQTTLSEMARVVKPGGWVVNIDTSPDVKFPGYWFYFSKVMPALGRLISQDDSAYDYLCQSTQGFPPPKELKKLFEAAGMTDVKLVSLALGSVGIQAGQA